MGDEVSSINLQSRMATSIVCAKTSTNASATLAAGADHLGLLSNAQLCKRVTNKPIVFDYQNRNIKQ